jgi:hypothetical protein
MVFDGTQNRATLATRIEICVDDPGVGFTLRPAGLHSANPIAHCDDVVEECTGSGGTDVWMDGTTSSDPNAPPGLPDDGLSFFWYERYGDPEQTLVGQGSRLSHRFPRGTHELELLVLDAEGLVDRTTCPVNVTDTTPPDIGYAAVTPGRLFPPDHRMVAVDVDLGVADTCGEAFVDLRSVVSDEPDDAPGTEDGATSVDIQDVQSNSPDTTFWLRAERDRTGSGRTYTITYDVRDERFNTESVVLEVEVPIDFEGSVDPIGLSLGVDGATGNVRIDWQDAEGVGTYDLVRGDLASVTPGLGFTHMGAVDCLAVGTNATRVVDTNSLSPGAADFYLVSSVVDQVPTGFGAESAAAPRHVPACRTRESAVPEPERSSDVTTNWGWLLEDTGEQVVEWQKANNARLVDIDRVGADRYQVVTVRNSGPTYWTPAYWFPDLSSSEVFVKRLGSGLRILDVEPRVVGDQTLFTVSMIPNDGEREKTWWWDHDQTETEVLAAIAANGMRLIDIEPYEKAGQTLYAWVGIRNDGVDQDDDWQPVFERSFEGLASIIADSGRRAIDIERHENGKFSAVLVGGDGTHWWWGSGASAEDLGTFLDNKAARLVDLERYVEGGATRYAFVAIDNVATEEGRRLRGLMDQAFSDPGFGDSTRRGFLVKEVGGPVVAEVGARLPFNPASTIKLVAHLYAVQEIDRGNESLQSRVEWRSDPSNPGRDCVPKNEGVLVDASYDDALSTMMWYSHNPTLGGFYKEFSPYDPDPAVDTLTSRARNEWGMADTAVYEGCEEDPSPNWLDNRTTLWDLATMYEGVSTATLFDDPASSGIFWSHMINLIQDDCRTAQPNDPGCTCPDYVDEASCVGNLYWSPYYMPDLSNPPDGIPDPIGPAWANGILGNLVSDEAPAGTSSAKIDEFWDNVIIRGKGGSASGAAALRADAMVVTLPFKDGNGNIVPRSFVSTFYANDWDDTCGGMASADCDDLIQAADGALGVFKREILRLPVRQAWASW